MPFDIQIGLCVVVLYPWGNKLVLLDMSKGRLVTDEEGRIIGNEAAGGSSSDSSTCHYQPEL